jgi:hypothetical protein
MRNATPPRNARAPRRGWGYAIAGGLALTAAAAVQFALADQVSEALHNLPSVGPAFESVGLLGVTGPVAGLGLGLVLLDVLRHLRRPAAAPAGREEGQPEGQGTDGPLSGAKIPALPGRAVAPGGKVGGPPGQSAGNGNGQVRLASAKYLGRKGKSGG